MFSFFFLQVSPQFDSVSLAAVPKGRRGNRKCPSTTSILDHSTQLTKKTSVCKFPSLSFQERSRDQSNQPKRTNSKKALEASRELDLRNNLQESNQTTNIVSSARYIETPKRKSATIRKGNGEKVSDGAASFSRCTDQFRTASLPGETCRIQSNDTSTPASIDLSNAEMSSVGPAPDVDTPKLIQGESNCPSSTTEHCLLARPCTPTCNEPPDILAADSPEEDYGLKVTWRRRKSVMLRLKEQGHLNDSDVLISS